MITALLLSITYLLKFLQGHLVIHCWVLEQVQVDDTSKDKYLHFQNHQHCILSVKGFFFRFFIHITIKKNHSRKSEKCLLRDQCNQRTIHQENDWWSFEVLADMLISSYLERRSNTPVGCSHRFKIIIVSVFPGVYVKYKLLQRDHNILWYERLLILFNYLRVIFVWEGFD